VFNVKTSNVSVSTPPSGTGGVTVTSINGAQLPTALYSDQVAVIASPLIYRGNQTFLGKVTLQNISNSIISGPFQILFPGLPPDAIVTNATGNLSGTPYLTVPAPTSLAPRESVTVGVQYGNLSDPSIVVSPAIYSGSIN
jgi:hypothetical protein